MGSSTGSNRVFRGGSGNFFPRFCRSAFRAGLSPVIRGIFLGFRVAQVPAE